MAYVTPTAADFKARFPEFETVPDALVNAIITEQEPQVGVTWVDADRRPALLHLVAHLLSWQGYPAATATEAAQNMLRGPMKRRKVGDVEVEYAGATASAGEGGLGGYGSTSYGMIFLTYLRRNFSGVRVV